MDEFADDTTFEYQGEIFRFRLAGRADHVSTRIRKQQNFYELSVLQRVANFDFDEGWAVDVGANLGNHTVFFARHLGLNTIAIEPQQVLATLLEHNSANNGVSDLVEIHQVAAWDACVHGRMVGRRESNLGGAAFQQAELAEQPADVEARTVDDIVGDRAVALMKVDVEGGESRVLKGALGTIANSRPLIVVECQSPSLRRDVDELLKPLGYLRLGQAGATPTYFYGVPRQALNVTFDGRLDASRALYALNPKRYGLLLDAERKKREAVLDRRQAQLRDAMADEIASLHQQIGVFADQVRQLEEERVRDKAEIANLKRKVSHSRFLRERLHEKVKFLMNERERSLAGRALHLAQAATQGGVKALQTYPEYVASLERHATRRWLALQRDAARAAAREQLFSGPEAPHATRVSVCVASFPGRMDHLAEVVGRLLPQCDRLYVYLNEYEDVPAFLRHPSIVVTRSQDADGDIKDNGKFFHLDQLEPGYHFFIDDDIYYPPDYCKRMIEAIRQCGYRAVVGAHGTIYRSPAKSYLNDRSVIHFKDAAAHAFVDQLGTGTIAYHSNTFRPAYAEFGEPGVADLWLARQAARQGVPMLVVRRGPNWLRPMPELDTTLFRLLQKDEAAQSRLFQDELVPLLHDGPRARVVNCLRSTVRDTRLEERGLDVRTSTDGVFADQTVRQHPNRHFALIVVGWNCASLATACFDSIEMQIPGNYTCEVLVYDDGSTDGTDERITAANARLNLRYFRGDRNRGPAFARHFLLQQVEMPSAICVLLDLDDALLPDALQYLADLYGADERLAMTYGNWINQHGETNPEPLIDEADIGARLYRRQEQFAFTHLRSFRRHLYDAVTPENLQDEHGTWLRYCSDVGLTFALADQCEAYNLKAVRRPLYRYNQRLPNGTLQRYGAEKKRETFRYLQSNSQLFRYKERLDAAD